MPAGQRKRRFDFTPVIVQIIVAVTAIVVAVIGARGVGERAGQSAGKTAGESAGAEAGAKSAGDAVARLIREVPGKKSVVIATTTWIASYTLTVENGVSEAFPVPKSFAGLLIVHGPGGNQQKVFAIGADGNANFADGGFITPLGQHLQVGLQPEQKGAGAWRLNNVADPEVPFPRYSVQVTLVGTGEPGQ